MFISVNNHCELKVIYLPGNQNKISDICSRATTEPLMQRKLIQLKMENPEWEQVPVEPHLFYMEMIGKTVVFIHIFREKTEITGTG